MSTLSAAQIASILYEALAEPVGLRIETNNPELLRQRLYTERRKDPDLEQLSIHISPSNPTSEVWIVNKGAQS